MGVDVWAGSNTPGSGTVRSSSRIVSHSSADMALIQLSSPMPIGGCIGAATLPSSPVADNTDCYITGWGRLYHQGPGASTLMEAQTRVVNKASCRQQMGSGGFNPIYDGDVCVFGYMNGKPTSACNGDSGGPLVCGGVLYGATSWGKDCNGISIYAGTYAQRSWIDSYIGTPLPTPSLGMQKMFEMAKDAFQAKAGNISCYLQEFNYIDEDMNLNLQGMLQEADSYDWQGNEWLHEKNKQGIKDCYDMVQSIPKNLLEHYGNEKHMRVKKFMMCNDHMMKMECMCDDAKKMLEKHFKPL